MLVSIAAYALIWGWQFAVGFVLLLLVHEMGHVIQLRREGIEASAPMFIPFLGAVVAAKSLGDDAAAEARVGLAGPILGTIGTLVPLGDLARHRRGVLAGARLRRLLPQPLQPAAGAAARRRPGDGGALALGLVRRLRRAGRAHVRLPEPDPDPDPAASAAMRAGGAGRTATRPSRAPSTRSRRAPGRWSRSSTSASPRRSPSASPRPSSRRTSTTSRRGVAGECRARRPPRIGRRRRRRRPAPARLQHRVLEPRRRAPRRSPSACRGLLDGGDAVDPARRATGPTGSR